MVKDIQGLYRYDGADGTRLAAVVYGGSAPFNVPEAYYRFRGCLPDFDALPTKAQYEAAATGSHVDPAD